MFRYFQLPTSVARRCWRSRPTASTGALRPTASGPGLSATASALALVAALAGGLSGAGPAGAQGGGGGCLGEPPGAVVPQRPGPALRFGITPGAVAGQVGAPAAAKPEDQAATLSALGQLRPPDAPFVLRLNRIFWSEGAAGIERFLALAHAYTRAGFLVELQLRYQPPAGHDGDIAGWTDFVRQAVRRFGPDRGVVGVQVTNEVNFTASPDSSDGSNQGARDALIQGVIAAHQEAARLGFTQLRVGFNWFYRTDPSSEQSFWAYLAAHGGAAFVSAVDWVGLDIYPGTFFPPADTPGGERDAIVNGLSTLRCFMPQAGLGDRVPIYVEENGYPTGPGRSEAAQLAALEAMIPAFNDFRGTYNVSDYRWFNLRDADSSSPNFQQQFGLLHDDYSPKPAFGAYAKAVARLSVRQALPGSGPAGSNPPRSGKPPRRRRRGAGRALKLTVRGRPARSRGGRRCLRPPLVVGLRGVGVGAVRRVAYFIAGRRVGGTATPPYRRRLSRRALARGGGYRIRARVEDRQGRPRTLVRRVRVCRSHG